MYVNTVNLWINISVPLYNNITLNLNVVYNWLQLYNYIHIICACIHAPCSTQLKPTTYHTCDLQNLNLKIKGGLVEQYMCEPLLCRKINIWLFSCWQIWTFRKVKQTKEFHMLLSNHVICDPICKNPHFRFLHHGVLHT